MATAQDLVPGATIWAHEKAGSNFDDEEMYVIWDEEEKIWKIFSDFPGSLKAGLYDTAKQLSETSHAGRLIMEDYGTVDIKEIKINQIKAALDELKKL